MSKTMFSRIFFSRLKKKISASTRSIITPINYFPIFLIARRCEERGILFLPVPSRLQEGKQVYRCGEQNGSSLLIYIDRNAIFVLNKESGMWIPTSLNTLLDDCMKMKV